MRKTTMNTILTLIADIDNADAQAVRDELNAELAKSAERAQANANVYELAKAVVLNTMEGLTAPVTIGELYNELEGELPEGFTKGKLQYAVTRLWTDSIAKIEGKVNTYTLKA